MPKALEGCYFLDTIILVYDFGSDPPVLNLCRLKSYRFIMHWFLEHPIYAGTLLALIFEIITVILRFGFKFTSPTHTKVLSRFTSGFRVHHGYPGAGMLMVVPLIPNPTIVASLVIILGIMLFLSDLIHHSIVLPICVGNHEFDIKYPT